MATSSSVQKDKESKALIPFAKKCIVSAMTTYFIIKTFLVMGSARLTFYCTATTPAPNTEEDESTSWLESL